MSFADDTEPFERIDAHMCACGVRYTEEEWAALECPGILQFQTGYAVELRQCLCGSTMARVLRPVTADVQEYLDAQEGRDAA
jgi:hypothetical protein